jgi:hypothetical protein
MAQMNAHPDIRTVQRTTNRKKRALRIVGVPAALVLALSVGLAISAGIGSARPAVAPNNTQPPVITGKAQVGVTLKADNGTFTGTAPITYTYQWRICNETGGACHDITGASGNEYTVKADDTGNTIRVVVTAKNADGTDSATSVPTAAVTAASAPPASTGCTTNGGTVQISGMTPPARLNIDQQQVSPTTITYGTRDVNVRFHIAGCGGNVQGALVYVTAVPYGMFAIPNEATTGADGWATLDMKALSGFPVSKKQQLLVMFVRARKNGEDLLGGISSRRLVSFKVTKG